MPEISDLEKVKVYDLARKPEHSSRTHPDLPNKPGGPDNWVEKAGGLPSYIKRIAKHIFYDTPGMTVSHAIAAAVNRIKVLAAKGNAQAVAALAQWESKKASSHALEEEVLEEKENVIDLSILRQVRSSAYSTFGNKTSAVSTGVKGASYDEKKHPRQGGGKFGTKFNPSDLIAAKRRIEGGITNLGVGQNYKLPDKLGWVKRTPGGYFIQGGGGFTASVRTLSEAITAAASLLAKKGFDK